MFLQDLTVDIVLTDYCMPEMTGYDLLKAIKVTQSSVDFNSVELYIIKLSEISDAELLESDPGRRDVVGERAPADQQVKFSPFFRSCVKQMPLYTRTKAAFGLWLCSVHGLTPFWKLDFTRKKLDCIVLAHQHY